MLEVPPNEGTAEPHEPADAIAAPRPSEAAPPSGGPTEPAGPPPEDAVWINPAYGPVYLPRMRASELPGSVGHQAAAPAAVAAPVRRRSLARTAGRLLREVAETVVLALLIFLLVRSVVQNFQVEGRSMEPTLETGWYLLVNKVIYAEINLKTVNKFLPFIDPGDDPTRYVFRPPRRGDVIVFEAPGQVPGEAERDFIKRIIGLPGETVEVHDCTTFVNGKPLDEPYIAEKPLYEYGPETVPPGHFFVLGDNRNNSSDSHSWGMLPKENIIGQAWLSYWPFSTFGLVDNTSVEPGESQTEGSAAEVRPVAACP